MSPSGGQKVDPRQLNAAARVMVLNQSVDMVQQIFANSINPASVGNVVNVIPRMVGLIKGFWVKVTATVTNNSGATINLSDFGPANILSQITFTDLSNNIRIQTTGWHLAFVNSIKAKRPYGAAFKNTAMDDPINFGANWTVQQASTGIVTTGTGTIQMWYYVPLAYSDSDLRGAVYANVVNATMQLQLTINPQTSVVSGDSTSSIYTGATAANVVLNPVAITVYQHYLDKIPMGQGGQPILPMIDLSTIYELKNTSLTAIQPNQDFPIQYANFRDFLSTISVYYNGSSRGVGADINSWALQSANFTNIFKEEPNLVALRTRNHLTLDLPPGTYYFGSRQKPIATTQYGNMQLVLNALTAGAGAYLLMGYEDMALVNTLTQAGSLPAS
jgi:hypothetical protein